MDEVWDFHSLPFGWTHSLVIATELLAKTLAKFDMPDIRPVQYVDDILVYGFDRDRVREAGWRLWKLLEQDGWLCSPKSQLEPATVIDWIGKTLDGQDWSMQSSGVWGRHGEHVDQAGDPGLPGLLPEDTQTTAG